jgi:hypothetical protein
MIDNGLREFFVAGTDLNALTGFEVDKILVADVGDVSVNNVAVARNDGLKGMSMGLGERPIIVNGHIDTADWYAYQAARDDLLQAVYVGATGRNLQAELKVKITNSTYRLFYGTCKNPIITYLGNGKATVDLQFVCADSFGYDVADTSLTFPGTPATGSTSSQTVNISAKYIQLPVIALTLSSLTGATSGQIVLKNTTTNEQITIPRTFTNADIVVINAKLKLVTVNGVEVEAFGKPLTLLPGNNTITHQDTFTTRSIAFTGSYNRRYM